MTVSYLLRFFRTIRHLRLRQIGFRVWRRLRPHGYGLPGNLTVHVRPNFSLLPGVARFLPPGGEWEFSFLNVNTAFPNGEVDWLSGDKSKLWRYNLHYFDYLLDRNRSWESSSRLIDDWIVHNPSGSADAWEPFPVSLRVVNWIKFFLRPDNRQKVRQEWLISLFGQMLWLENNVEYHLLANHLFRNAKALVFGGLFFAGDDAERWLQKGVRLLSGELDEQILPDGGHFERSPMYHAMILADCLDLLNLTQQQADRELAGLAARLQELCPAMLSALAVMSHPDGDISLFNDAAFGIEPRFGELAEYYQRLAGRGLPLANSPIRSLADTGYFAMTPSPGSCLIIDCGAVGPDYQPGHAHCDTLSFELSLGSRRVIVDSGCSHYPDSDIRKYNRGNVGHNSVTIDGRNQSEVWGAHRCGRRARPLDASLERLPDGTLRFCGAHDGYRHLPGKPVHRRTITWLGKIITIVDDVYGGGCHDIELRLHINPELMVEAIAAKTIIRDGNSLIATILSTGTSKTTITGGCYCPEFGRVLPTHVLVLSHRAVSLPFRTGWQIQLP